MPRRSSLIASRSRTRPRRTRSSAAKKTNVASACSFPSTRRREEATTTMDNEMPIPGWGVDRRLEDRPGVPLEQERHVGHDTLQGQPPYTDTIPLKGLSGVLRRAAYAVPDWKPRRWMMLMLADRVDALESKLTLRNLLLTGGLTGVIAALAGRRKRRR